MNTIKFNGREYPCPFIDLMPPLTGEELRELKADIQANGITYPVVVTESGEIIDGHNRLTIAVELGITDVTITELAGLSEARKRERAADLNLHRRHLTRDQRREIVASILKREPERSNNDIAASCGASDKTVASVRDRLEATSEIPKLPTTRGRDGKRRKAMRQPRRQPVPLPAPVPGPDTALRSGGSEAVPPSLPEPSDQPGKPLKFWATMKHESDAIYCARLDLDKLIRLRRSERDVSLVQEIINRVQRVADSLRRKVTEGGTQ